MGGAHQRERRAQHKRGVFAEDGRAQHGWALCAEGWRECWAWYMMLQQLSGVLCTFTLLTCSD